MEVTVLETKAKTTMVQVGFISNQEVYRGTWYDGQIRSLVYIGEYQQQPAVFKIYQDPRHINEAQELEEFQKVNQSTWLKSPKVFSSHVESLNSGWVIMEAIPATAKTFISPLSVTERQEFLKVYLEYRKQFPTVSTRPLISDEQLTADQFQAKRISNWKTLAESVNTKLVQEHEALYERATEFIVNTYHNQPMIWSHGHVKPNEVHNVGEKYYLTDFGHTKYFPIGYEFAFIIWADVLMTTSETRTYQELQVAIQAWLKDITPIAVDLEIVYTNDLVKASVLERVLGTVYADTIAAVKVPPQLKHHRLTLMNQLIKDMVEHA